MSAMEGRLFKNRLFIHWTVTDDDLRDVFASKGFKVREARVAAVPISAASSPPPSSASLSPPASSSSVPASASASTALASGASTPTPTTAAPTTVVTASAAASASTPATNNNTSNTSNINSNSHQHQGPHQSPNQHHHHHHHHHQQQQGSPQSQVKSRSFGFVTFETEQDAEAALKLFNEQHPHANPFQLTTRNLFINYSQSSHHTSGTSSGSPIASTSSLSLLSHAKGTGHGYGNKLTHSPPHGSIPPPASSHPSSASSVGPECQLANCAKCGDHSGYDCDCSCGCGCSFECDGADCALFHDKASATSLASQPSIASNQSGSPLAELHPPRHRSSAYHRHHHVHSVHPPRNASPGTIGSPHQPGSRVMHPHPHSQHGYHQYNQHGAHHTYHHSYGHYTPPASSRGVGGGPGARTKTYDSYRSTRTSTPGSAGTTAAVSATSTANNTTATSADIPLESTVASGAESRLSSHDSGDNTNLPTTTSATEELPEASPISAITTTLSEAHQIELNASASTTAANNTPPASNRGSPSRSTASASASASSITSVETESSTVGQVTMVEAQYAPANASAPPDPEDDSRRGIFTLTRPKDFRQVVEIKCRPDPAVVAPSGETPIVLSEDLKGQPRVYNRSPTPVPAVNRSKVLIKPQLGSNILADVCLGGKNLKIISIEVALAQDDIRVAINMGNMDTGRTGQAYIRRVKEPETNQFVIKRKYFDMVNPRTEEQKLANIDLFDIDFVAIESITVDPITGVWTDLYLALDSVRAPHPPSNIPPRRRVNAPASPSSGGGHSPSSSAHVGPPVGYHSFGLAHHQHYHQFAPTSSPPQQQQTQQQHLGHHSHHHHHLHVNTHQQKQQAHHHHHRHYRARPQLQQHQQQQQLHSGHNSHAGQQQHQPQQQHRSQQQQQSHQPSVGTFHTQIHRAFQQNHAYSHGQQATQQVHSHLSRLHRRQ